MGYFKKREKKHRLRNLFLKVVLCFFLINYISKKIEFDEKYLKYLTNSYMPFEVKEIKVAQYPVDSPEEKPVVYIYNTHQSEKYDYSKPQPFNIDYDVQFASFILAGYLEDYGINTVVETGSMASILTENNLAYHESYKGSRLLLEQSIINYPTLMYFIDLHRDSVSREVTTTTIGDDSYAKVLFVIGMEHENYAENLALANALNERIKRINPSLTRGVSQKSGSGVNGIYNQDFSSRTLLIEVGGQYSYIEEVNNTLKVLASVLYEYIMEDE